MASWPFIVTNLAGAPRWRYEHLYCGRDQAENLIKAHFRPRQPGGGKENPAFVGRELEPISSWIIEGKG